MAEEEREILDGQDGSVQKSISRGMNKSVMETAFLNKLRAGAIFLLHRQHRRPHYRAVWAEDDLSCINWGDLKRKKTSGRIYTQSLIEVTAGHDSKILKKADKHSDPKKCFSLVTANRTLDLEGISEEQREAWVMAFKFLLEYSERCNEEDQNFQPLKRKGSKHAKPRVSIHSEDDDNEENVDHKDADRDSPLQSGPNLLDLISKLNKRLETTDNEASRLKRNIEKWKTNNRTMYMSAVKMSLETQRIVDALKYHEDFLMQENKRLTQQFKETEQNQRV